jgi:toxin ParE1/3/4
MPPFKLSSKAKGDLKNIGRYTQIDWGREQRNLYLKQTDETFHTLSGLPSLGLACDYIKPGYRKFPQGSHIVYYREGTVAKIEIIRLLHKNMDAGPALGA